MPVSQEVSDGDMVVGPAPRRPTEPPIQKKITLQPDHLEWEQPSEQPEEDVPEHTTSVHLNAACDLDPPSTVVVAGRAEPALCEHIIAIAYFEDHGDLYDIGRWFTWSNDASTDIAINCIGLGNDFCWATGIHDLFDTDDLEEPEAFVMACTENECTEAMPGCQPIVCSSIQVLSIVNLEGTWTSSWASVPDGEVLTFMQDGRTIQDASAHTKFGWVQGAHVSFDKGDYRFEGDLSSDRTTIEGAVTDLITNSPAGNWTMVRTIP